METRKHESRRKWFWYPVENWKRSLLFIPETLLSEKHPQNLFLVRYDFTTARSVKWRRENMRAGGSDSDTLLKFWKRSLLFIPETLLSEKHPQNLFLVKFDFTTARRVKRRRENMRAGGSDSDTLLKFWKRSLLFIPETLLSEKHPQNLLFSTISEPLEKWSGGEKAWEQEDRGLFGSLRSVFPRDVENRWYVPNVP